MKNTTNTTVATNKKVDFFASSRELSTRTSEFFRVVVKRAELNTIYRAKIDNIKNTIATLEDMEKDGTKLMTKEEVVETIEKNNAILVSFEKELVELLEEQAKFTYTDTDKNFKKAIHKAESINDVKKAVREFYATYNLTIDNTTFEKAVLESIGKRVNVKTIVKSNGTKALVYDATNALKNLYAVGFEFMVESGTIKNADIPTVLAEKYAKKPSKKAEQKESK